MTYVCFSFLANITYALLPDRNAIVEKGYMPLLDTFDAYPEVSCELFFSGYTGLWLKDHYPEFVERVRQGIATGKYHLGTCTYSMPLIPSLSMTSTRKQVQTGLQIDAEIWGVRPHAFWPPHYAWDPTLTKVLSDEKVQWVLYWPQNIKNGCDCGPYYPSWDKLNPYLPFQVDGLNNTSVAGICCLGRNFNIIKDADPFEQMKGVLEEINAKTAEPALLVLDADTEMYYATECVGVARNASDRLRRLIDGLLNMNRARFCSIDAYLQRCNTRQRVFLPPGSGAVTSTAIKLQRMSECAEAVVVEAERRLEAEDDGRRAALCDRLTQAWRLLLLSQNGDCRWMDGSSGIPWKPYPDLIKECMKAAWKSQTIAEGILSDMKRL